MKTRILAVLLLAAALPCGLRAQALWNGLNPQQTASNPLQLRVSDGDLSSTLGTSRFNATNLVLTPNATNYVYLDVTVSPPKLTVNTTGFPTASIYKIAIAVTNANKITSLTDARPTFNSLLYPGGAGSSNYQTVQQAGTPETQRPNLNFLSPFTATDNAGNTSTDIGISLNYQTIFNNASSLPVEPKLNCVPPLSCVDNPGSTRTDINCPTMVGVGASHAAGCVGDPGATSHNPKYYWDESGNFSLPSSNTATANPLAAANLSNSAAPWHEDVDTYFKGPNPFFNVMEYGGYIGPNYNSPTTGNITGGVNAITLASASDFANGQGILILGVGAAPSISTPTGVTATGSGVTGSTTYTYCVVDEDYSNGRTACSATGAATNGVATLGLQATTLSGCSRVSGLVTCTTTTTHNYHINNQVDILRSSTNDASFEGTFTITGVTTNTFQFTQYGLPDDSALSSGTARVLGKVVVSWNAPTNNTVLKHIIYRCTTTCTLPANAANYVAAGVATGNDSYWVDHGFTLTCAGGLLTNVDNGDATCAAPTAATNQWFPTTISSGGGTTSLTLAANATNTGTGVQVRHDNTPALNAACAALISGGTIVIPATPNTSYEFPIASTFNMPSACSKQVEVQFGTEVWATAPIIPKGASQLVGTASGTVSQFPNFTGVSNIVWFNGFAYPFIFMESATSSNLGLSSMQFACNQTDQACIYQDAGTTGAGSVSIRYKDVYPIAGTQSTAYVVKGGFSYYWYGGGWTATPADFSGPPAALLTLNCGTGQTGQLLPAQLYTDKTFAFGGVLMDSCLVTPTGAGGGGGMEFRGMIAESNYGPMFRANTPNAGIAAIDFYFPEYADYLGGGNVPLIDITNVSFAGSIRVIHPLCATGGQPVFQTNTTNQYQLEVINQTQGCTYVGSNYYKMDDDQYARSVLSNYTQSLISGAESIYQMATPGPAQSVAISSGGSVPIAAHSYTITAVDFNGRETAQSTAVSGTTTTGNQTATITLPATLPVGATGFNVYRDGALTNLNSCLIPQFTTAGGTAVDTSATRCGAIPQVVTQAGSTIMDQTGLLAPQIRLIPPASAPTNGTGVFTLYGDPTTFWPSGKKSGSNTARRLLAVSGSQTIGHSVCFNDTTTGDMADCAGSAGNVNNAQQFSVAYYSAAGSANTISGIAGPTTPNNVFQYFGITPSGGVATTGTFGLAGLPGRSNSAATDTILATDRVNRVEETNAGATAVAIAGPGTAGFTQNFAFKLKARGSGNVITLTPGAGNCNGASTCTINQGQDAAVSSPDNTNYFAEIHDPPITCGTNLTCVRADYGLTINSSAGGNMSNNIVNTMTSAGTIDGSAMATTAGMKVPVGAGAVPTADGAIANNSTNHTLVTGSNGTTDVVAVAATGTGTATTCTNQVITAVSGIAAPTCSTITNAMLTSGTKVQGQAITLGSNTDITNGGTTHGLMVMEGASSAAGTLGTGTTNQVVISGGSSADPNYKSLTDITNTTYIAGAGSVNAMTATLAPAMATLTTGNEVKVLPNLANTTTNPTLNVNGTGATNIKKCGTTALVASDYTTTSIAIFVYDGTNWQLINPQAAACGAGSSQVNGSGISSPVNFNNTTPAAPVAADAQNCIWQASGSSVSCNVSNVLSTASRWSMFAWSHTNGGFNTSGDMIFSGGGSVCTTASDTAPTATAPPLRTCGTGATANTTQNFSFNGGDVIFGTSSNPTNLHLTTSGKISATTTIRAWMAVLSDAAAGTLGTTDSPTTSNVAGIRFSSVAGDTNFTLVLCNASACSTTSTGVAGDTSFHRFEVRMNDATGTASGCVDGTCVTATTDYPNSVVLNGLGAGMVVDNTTTTAVTMSFSKATLTTTR